MEETSGIWFEEELAPNFKWQHKISEIAHVGVSKYQKVELMTSKYFGKMLVLDGKMQSSQLDEHIYHELLVHPALLHHPNPKKVFICGGGEGATAREVLRHKSVEKVVMVDIDEVVCKFCEKYLERNQEAFRSPKLELHFDDARAHLENINEKFDVIIADLADPLEGGPCYQLYTKDFYENVVKQKLNKGGIFVTQSTSCHIKDDEALVFASILKTLQSVFPKILMHLFIIKHLEHYVKAIYLYQRKGVRKVWYSIKVIPYTNNIPSFYEEWTWCLCFTNQQQVLDSEGIDDRITQNIQQELDYLDGLTWQKIQIFNKIIRKKLQSPEVEIFTADNPKFIHGFGLNQAM